jgi:hypothetical protein
LQLQESVDTLSSLSAEISTFLFLEQDNVALIAGCNDQLKIIKIQTEYDEN